MDALAASLGRQAHEGVYPHEVAALVVATCGRTHASRPVLRILANFIERRTPAPGTPYPEVPTRLHGHYRIYAPLPTCSQLDNRPGDTPMPERSASRDAFCIMVGERIRDLRISKGMSQVAVAALADCSQPGLSAYERGRRDPPFSILVTIAEALGTTPDTFAGL